MAAKYAPILSVAQMREADRRCIEELGIPGAVLMNNAGTRVFEQLPTEINGSVTVVCGKGNNGGDGFVVARLALLAGLDVRVILLTDPGAIRGDAATFLHAYQRLGGPLLIAPDIPSATRALHNAASSAILIDAMLGTGVTGTVHGVFLSTIEAWPHVHTIAVDIPSGLDADTGLPCGTCIRAGLTVTFQFLKTGLAAPSAAPYAGRVIVADIGIPDACADDAAWLRLRQTWESAH